MNNNKLILKTMTMKSYNFKYDTITRTKFREIQEFLEKTKSKATLNDTLIFCIANTFDKIKSDENNNSLFSNVD